MLLLLPTLPHFDRVAVAPAVLMADCARAVGDFHAKHAKSRARVERH